MIKVEYEYAGASDEFSHTFEYRIFYVDHTGFYADHTGKRMIGFLTCKIYEYQFKIDAYEDNAEMLVAVLDSIVNGQLQSAIEKCTKKLNSVNSMDKWMLEALNSKDPNHNFNMNIYIKGLPPIPYLKNMTYEELSKFIELAKNYRTKTNKLVQKCVKERDITVPPIGE